MATQKATPPGKPKCFVVSPIGNPTSPERKHANVVLKFIIRPVLDALGFDEPLRADNLAEPGIISRQIISLLLNSDLVIADLTGRNPNVFYELAIRHATGKPFIQLITRGEVIPFDVGHQRTIQFDRTDLEDVEICKIELQKQIEATQAPSFKVETPIGHALDFERLRGGSSTDQALSVIIDRLDRLDVIARNSARSVGRKGMRAFTLAATEPELNAISEAVMGWGYANKASAEYCDQTILDFWQQVEELKSGGLVILPPALGAAATAALDAGSKDIGPFLRFSAAAAKLKR